MGQPSLISDPFNMEEWFNAFITKVKNAGPHKIPEDHIRFMHHAFAAGWNSRGSGEDFVFQQAGQMVAAAKKEMNDHVIRYFKSVENEHKAMDDLIDDLQKDPNI